MIDEKTIRSIISYLTSSEARGLPTAQKIDLAKQKLDANQWVNSRGATRSVISEINELLSLSDAEEALRRVLGAQSVSEALRKSRAQKKKSESRSNRKKPAKNVMHTSDHQITQYTTVSARDDARLVNAVNKKIRDGWQPIGGVSVAVRHEPKVEVLWSQALVYREKD